MYLLARLCMISGEWTIKQEKKTVKGHIDVPEFSFGELDDLQVHCSSFHLCILVAASFLNGLE